MKIPGVERVAQERVELFRHSVPKYNGQAIARTNAPSPKGTVVLVDASSDGHHETYALRLMDGLGTDGFTPLFLAGKDFAASGVGGIFRRLALPKSPFLRIYAFVEAVIFARFFAHRVGAKVIHFLAADGLVLPLSICLPFYGSSVATVLTIHWSTSVDSGPKGGRGIRRLYHLAKERAFKSVCARADAVIAHGPRSAARLRSLAGESSAKIVEIPYGTDVPASLPSSEEARRLLDLPNTERLILSFGAPRPDKGLDGLLSCLSSAPLKGILVIAGGKGDVEIEATIQDCRFPLIRRSGWIPEAEVSLYFAASDVVVLPYSPIFGGQSGPLVLAAAHGVPVVCTDVGDVGPTVRDHGFGIVVPPNDLEALRTALEAALGAPEPQRLQWAGRGREYARACTWGAYASRVASVYREVSAKEPEVY